MLKSITCSNLFVERSKSLDRSSGIAGLQHYRAQTDTNQSEAVEPVAIPWLLGDQVEKSLVIARGLSRFLEK